MGIRGEPNPTPFTEAIQARRESLPGPRTIKSRRAIAARLGISESTYQMAELGYTPIAEHANAILDVLFSNDPNNPLYDPAERTRIEALMQPHERPVPSADQVIEQIVNALNAQLPGGARPYPIVRFSHLLRAQREELDILLTATGRVTEFSYSENENYSGGSTNLNIANELIACLTDGTGKPAFPNGLDQHFYLSGIETIARQERRAAELPDALWGWRSWGGEQNGAKWTPRIGRVPLSQSFGVSEMSIRDIECEGTPRPTHAWAERLTAHFSTSLGLNEFTIPADIRPATLPMDEDTFLTVGMELARRLRRDYGIDRTREPANHPQAVSFGAKVKALRDLLGISQLDLGRLLEGTTDDSDYVIRARVSNVELGNFKNPLDSAEQDAFRAAFGLGPQEFERYGVAARKVITLRDRSFMPAVAIVMKEAPLIQRELADELGVKRQTLGALMSTARKANSIHAAHVDLITKTLRDITDVLKDEKYDNLTIEGALYAAAGYITLDPAGGIDPTSMPFKSDGADCPLCVEDFKAAAEFRATFIAGHDTLFNADGTVVNNINGSTTQFTRSHRGKAVKRQRPR